MFCKECGKKIGSEARFCPFCGTLTEAGHTADAKTVRMTCKACRAVMETVPGTREIMCPYCGTRELIEDSDAVKKARINADIEKARLESEERITAERLKNERLLKEKQMKNAASKPVGTKFATVMLVFSLLMVIYSVSEGFLWPSVISVAQTVLFILTLLIAKGILGSRPALARLPRLIGLLLIIPFLMSVSGADDYKREHETYVWPKTDLAQMLPKPSVPYGKIDTVIDTRLRLELRMVTAEDRDSYIEETFEAGFDLEVSNSGSSYTAYNKDGYKLSVYFYSSLKQMDITLYAPLVLGSFSWPQDGPAALLPVPENDTGRIISDREDSFSAYIGSLDSAGFERYVTACRAAGFTEDYQKTEETYSAKNASGAELRITRAGYREYEVILKIRK